MPAGPGSGPSSLQLEVAAELFPDEPKGFPFHINPAEVQLPPGEDFGIQSDDDTQQEEDINEAEAGFGSVLVVMNLPVVPQEKYDKLAAVVTKIFGTAYQIREGGFFMPKDESGMSKGFAFIEFVNQQQALAAMEALNGKPLDKNHSFLVKPFSDIDRLAKLSDNYTPPPAKEFKAVDNLYSWMSDRLGRDQFVIKAGEETLISWNDGKRGRSEEVYRRLNWTESFHAWSPMGTYITTLHRMGAQIWAGPGWERINRFMHPGVRLLEFSPNERYLLTYSATDATGPRDNTVVSFVVHDVRTAQKLRVFEGPVEEFAQGTSANASGALKWPVFKWAGGKQDLYMARLGKNTLMVYQAPDMKLLDNKLVKLDGVQDFEWSPAEPVIAAYTAEQNQMPARIVLIRIPDRAEIRQKNLFSVKEIGIHWHPQGDYLCVKVERYTKSKKSSNMGFELFSIRDKDIPMEVLELPNKSERVIAFAWEPKGHRFAVVHGDGPRPSVSFYTMRDEKGRLSVKLLHTITNRACTQVYWSPQGKNILLAGLKSFNGQLEFYNVDDAETMATAEHFMCTDVDWDPTGRYIATSAAGHQMENGYMMWSFQGRLLYSTVRDRLFQFQWRPRLPSLLPPEKEADLTKNLKQYTKKYDEEDEALLMQADADVLQERQRLKEEWQAFVDKRREYVKMLEGFKREMYGPRYDEKPFVLQSASQEQVIETKEEVYKG